MTPTSGHRWQFKARFRRNAFGWRSQPAIQRVKQAVVEIKQVARKDPVLGAEGAVLFLERVSPALGHVDGSSGSMGTAVNNAIAALVPVIAEAPADAGIRDAWLERLWAAHGADEIPYIEILTDRWGDLCASKEVASAWADRLMGGVKRAWLPDQKRSRFFQGATACLSALFRAERHDELLALLRLNTLPMWHYQMWGVRALAALGRQDEAIELAESLRGSPSDEWGIARLSEEILLSSGQAEAAYRRYALTANQCSTHLATYRALVNKYPHRKPAEILADLVGSTPGNEGQWFAAAKSAGFLDVALQLARSRPCDPRTLARAARDYAESDPVFAIGVGLAALHWIVEGYGYDITNVDVWAAYSPTLKAAERTGRLAEVEKRIRQLTESDGTGAQFLAEVLARSPNRPDS